jgi:hypothetical protein
VIRADATALRRDVPPLHDESHGAGSRESPPEVAAQTIHHALTSERPKLHYPAGRDAWLLFTLLRILPTAALDTLRLRLFGLN